MSNELRFHMGDLYPQIGNFASETSTDANPDADDQIALNENANEANKTDTKQSRMANIFLAIALIVVLVVFLGMGD